MGHTHGYEFAATLPSGALPDGVSHFTVTVIGGGAPSCFPMTHLSRRPVASISARLSPPWTHPQLFAPATDTEYVAISRSGESVNRRPDPVAGSAPGTVAYILGFPGKAMAEDFTASLFVGDRVSGQVGRGQPGKNAAHPAKGARCSIGHTGHSRREGWGSLEREGFRISGMEGCRDSNLRFGRLALRNAAPGLSGDLGLLAPAPEGATSIHLADVERLQFSLRKSDFGTVSVSRSGPVHGRNRKRLAAILNNTRWIRPKDAIRFRWTRAHPEAELGVLMQGIINQTVSFLPILLTV